MIEYTKTTKEWAFQFGCCWNCGRRGAWPETLQIHHITRGANRQKSNLFTTLKQRSLN